MLLYEHALLLYSVTYAHCTSRNEKKTAVVGNFSFLHMSSSSASGRSKDVRISIKIMYLYHLLFPITRRNCTILYFQSSAKWFLLSVL